jgi:uncharacterized C2H2 Zn-finger protein
MIPAKLTVDARFYTCAECGVLYGVTEQFDERRREDGETFYCPNGHEQVYKGARREADDKSERTLAERQELVLAIHRAEQAEAKAAELAGAKAKPLQDGKPAAAEPAIDVRVRRDGYLLHCPSCDATYRSTVWLQRHLCQRHGVDSHARINVVEAKDE